MDNIAPMEMEENNGFFQSVTIIPLPPDENSSKSIPFQNRSNKLFGTYDSSSTKDERWDTPKLPTFKNSFRNAIRYVENANTKIVQRSTFDLK